MAKAIPLQAARAPSQFRRYIPALLVGAALLLVLYNLYVQPIGSFPAEWNIHLREPLDAFKKWVVGNRATSPFFVFIFEPISAGVDFVIRRAEDIPVVAALAGDRSDLFFARQQVRWSALGLAYNPVPAVYGFDWSVGCQHADAGIDGGGRAHLPADRDSLPVYGRRAAIVRNPFCARSWMACRRCRLLCT